MKNTAVIVTVWCFATLAALAYDDTPQSKTASPGELRNKKAIGGGLYTIYGEETAVTPGFIAKHPEFVDSYPFDGIVMPAVLSTEWVNSLGLTKMGKPLRPVFLNELLWTKIRIPDDAVAQTLADLKAMRRGSLTDNFLIVGMVDGARGLHTPDLANDDDWAILEHNARLAARICREGKMKGIWLDTEQYGHYRWRTSSGTPEFEADRPQGLHFPLGKDTPEVLRKRGTAWIKAVQAEIPDVKIITTFAWSPDSLSYGPLTGVIPFLDGVLEGIASPAQIIHGHENTFYFGQGKGTTHAYATENGFPGDRKRYDEARTEIRGWRSLSQNPTKYDQFVKVGMAAWVEDHPWNVPDGWPVGGKASLWSNLPLALAYSDEYVWVWSEHTKYGQPHLRELNPFLASLNNQTFNTGTEKAESFAEDFASDPLKHGWYFDFDMLAIGHKVDPTHEVPTMSVQSLPYVWDKSSRIVNVTNMKSAHLLGQRQRFVRPLSIDAKQSGFSASIDFQVDAFDGIDDGPMILGLFNSGRSLKDQSLSLQIQSQKQLSFVILSRGTVNSQSISVPDGLTLKTPYRMQLDFTSSTGELVMSLVDRSQSTRVSSVPTNSIRETLPKEFDVAGLDELGIAISEEHRGPIQPDQGYGYSVLGARFNRTQGK